MTNVGTSFKDNHVAFSFDSRQHSITFTPKHTINRKKSCATLRKLSLYTFFLHTNTNAAFNLRYPLFYHFCLFFCNCFFLHCKYFVIFPFFFLPYIILSPSTHGMALSPFLPFNLTYSWNSSCIIKKFSFFCLFSSIFFVFLHRTQENIYVCMYFMLFFGTNKIIFFSFLRNVKRVKLYRKVRVCLCFWGFPLFFFALFFLFHFHFSRFPNVMVANWRSVRWRWGPPRWTKQEE